jgi:hypothetical protein
MVDTLNTTGMTMIGINSFITSGSWGSTFLIVAAIAIILGLFSLGLASFERYKKYSRIITWIFGSLRYFGVGIMSLLTISVVGMPAYYFINQANKGNVVPLWITGAIIGGYFVITGIGYIVKKFVVDRIRKFNKRLKLEKQEVNQW